jgi:hypothetical protein
LAGLGFVQSALGALAFANDGFFLVRAESGALPRHRESHDAEGGEETLFHNYPLVIWCSGPLFVLVTITAAGFGTGVCMNVGIDGSLGGGGWVIVTHHFAVLEQSAFPGELVRKRAVLGYVPFFQLRGRQPTRRLAKFTLMPLFFIRRRIGSGTDRRFLSVDPDG